MKPLLFAAFLALGLAPGCKTIEAAVDCNAICGRYSTCFDATYDTAACESRCRGRSSKDSDYRRSADACSACIDDRACSSATFNCGVPCSSVVP